MPSAEHIERFGRLVREVARAWRDIAEAMGRLIAEVAKMAESVARGLWQIIGSHVGSLTDMRSDAQQRSLYAMFRMGRETLQTAQDYAEFVFARAPEAQQVQIDVPAPLTVVVNITDSFGDPVNPALARSLQAEMVAHAPINMLVRVG